MTFVPGPGDASSRFSSESEPQRGGDSELLSLLPPRVRVGIMTLVTKQF